MRSLDSLFLPVERIVGGWRWLTSRFNFLVDYMEYLVGRGVWASGVPVSNDIFGSHPVVKNPPQAPEFGSGVISYKKGHNVVK